MSFASGELPDCFKQAEISPILKKDDRLNKEIYRPVSFLPLLSKVYEKLSKRARNTHSIS